MVAANFLVVAARMSLVTFLGIYFVRKAGIDLATVGVALLLENVLRGVLAPMFGALSDRVGRRALLIAAALVTAAVLPCFLLVRGPASLFAWSVAIGVAGAVNMPVANALLLDLAPSERRQGVLAINYTVMSVAYTLGVMPAGYVAEQGYGLLALMSTTGFLMVALLYALALRGALPLEQRAGGSFLVHTLSAMRDRAFLAFASLGFVAAAFACYGAIPSPAAALLVGTVVFSFAELVFSSAVPAAVAHLAPAGRRGAYQGSWALVGSFSMGSALVVSGVLRDAIGWHGAWLFYAGLILGAALLLFATRDWFSRVGQ